MLDAEGVAYVLADAFFLALQPSIQYVRVAILPNVSQRLTLHLGIRVGVDVVGLLQILLHLGALVWRKGFPLGRVVDYRVIRHLLRRADAGFRPLRPASGAGDVVHLAPDHLPIAVVVQLVLMHVLRRVKPCCIELWGDVVFYPFAYRAKHLRTACHRAACDETDSGCLWHTF